MATLGSNYVHAGNYHALLVGINDYPAPLPALRGAVNDVRLLKATLEQLPDFNGRIIPLVNKSATRSAIFKQWQNILNNAKRGDTVLFAFSGHGYQEADLNGDEADRNGFNDQHDEILLLSGFSTTSSSAARNKLVDDELAELFGKAIQKGLRVIYLADACHSGDSSRAISKIKGLEFGSFRSLQLAEREESNLQRWFSAIFAEKKRAENHANHQKFPEDVLGLFTFSPVKSNTRSPEIILNGVHYGPLIWSFVKAMNEGDVNNDNMLSQAELVDYVEEKIRLLGVAKISPEFSPRKKLNEMLLPAARAKVNGLKEPHGLRDKARKSKAVLFDLIALEGQQPKSPLSVVLKNTQYGTPVSSTGSVRAMTENASTKLQISISESDYSESFLINFTINDDGSKTPIRCFPIGDSAILQVDEGVLGEQIGVVINTSSGSRLLYQQLQKKDCFQHSNFIPELKRLLEHSHYRLNVFDFFIGR